MISGATVGCRFLRTGRNFSHMFANWVVAGLCWLVPTTVHGASSVDVTTYHNDAGRTGWNAQETTLTPAIVGGGSFKRLHTVVLDAQVDAEPLYISAQNIPGKGIHNTVYVATENNSIYAIDADSGQILLNQNLGTPVPLDQLPGQCYNNSNIVGITATPVIDRVNKILYAITYNFESDKALYRIHALSLATLADVVPPTVIGATSKLTDQSSYRFDPSASRLRAALLLKSENLYAGFTSYCDNSPSKTRGWVLGWHADTLKPLSYKKLTNRLATSPNQMYLDSVWMSGYGIAADNAGNLYFVTGNSDPGNKSYYPTNLAESVVRLSSDLSNVSSYFTPSTAATGREALDRDDNDFGAGGAMVVPKQPGKYPWLTVAAGKVGILYLLNRQALGGYGNGVDHVLGAYDIGQCYCGPSYYAGADGIGRIVTSGGNQVEVWKIQTSTSDMPIMVKESTSPAIVSGQDSGFFTSVSSNGSVANTQVIWALSRPSRDDSAFVNLIAFDPSTINGSGHSKRLVSLQAGTWPNTGGNANLVPLVAGGHVFVASYKRLAIFGVAQPSAGAQSADQQAELAPPAPEARAVFSPHEIYGRLKSFSRQSMVIETRDGRQVAVAAKAARAAGTGAIPVVGRAYLVRGDYDKRGVLQAQSILRAKPSPDLWPSDR